MPNNVKEKKELVEKIVFAVDIPMTDQDKQLIQKLIHAYFRETIHFVNSKVEYIAGSVLWVYSSLNFLFEGDKKWTQKSIADKLDITSKSISRTSTIIRNALDIEYFDERFSRQDIIDSNPLNDFVMTEDGFIVHK